MILTIYCTDASSQQVKLHQTFLTEQNRTRTRVLTKAEVLEKTKDTAKAIAGPLFKSFFLDDIEDSLYIARDYYYN